MENSTSFFESPWVIGIICGIISGIVVFFITKWILQRKDKKKHIEQINQANHEAIRVLKPYIAEKGLPSREIIESIISSVARKYTIQPKEMYSIQVICEELIKEILENVYVANDKKQEYSNQLSDYILENNKPREDKKVEADSEKQLIQIIDRSKTRSKEYFRISILLGTIASILTILVTLLYRRDGSLFDNENFIIITFAISAFAIVSITFVTVFISLMEKYKKIKK